MPKFQSGGIFDEEVNILGPRMKLHMSSMRCTESFFSKNVKFMNCGYTHDINPSGTKTFANKDLFHLSIFSNRCDFYDPDRELKYKTECVNTGLGGSDGNSADSSSFSISPGSSSPSNDEDFVPLCLMHKLANPIYT